MSSNTKIHTTIFDDPDVRLRLRPKLLKLLSDLGVTPAVDVLTGQIVVSASAIAAAPGISEDEAIALAGPGRSKSVPADQVEPLQ
jgi:hypothetical protein